MSEPGSSRRGRTHDAEGAREAILNAAEIVFSEQGFEGARMDAIARQSGYNKSLLFQYFSDKQGLYTEIIRRADQETSELQARVLTPLLMDKAVVTDRQKFKQLLEVLVGSTFDYMVEHPRLVRILQWEQAEGWETYKKLLSQFNTDDMTRFNELFGRAMKAGLLRSDFSPIVQFALTAQVGLAYLAWLPIYQLMLPDQDFSAPAELRRVREYLVNFIVAGMLADPGGST
jgi:AcrR family transcriptional regulator